MHRCHTALSTYFTNLSLPVLEETYCQPCTNLQFQSLEIGETALLKGRAYKLAVVYANMIPWYKEHLADLRRMLSFKPEYSDAARKVLEKAAAESGLSLPTFVGLHNRRTDYKSTLMAYNKDFVGPEYFQAAMKLFRKTLENPVFIVVTDDMAWARRHITGKDVIYSETSREEGDDYGTGVDLATLALCNHTIITYGTFGLWGSLLSGGATIVSSRAVSLKGLIEEAGLRQFVFLDEEEEWESFVGAVGGALESL